MGTKINKELFISHLKDKYGDKVELISEYHGKERPVEILYHCEKHGDTTKWLNAKNIFGLNFNPCKECFKESHSKKKQSILLHLRSVMMKLENCMQFICMDIKFL